MNDIAEENSDPKEKYDYLKVTKVCRSGWRNLVSYYKNGEQSIKQSIIKYHELIDDIKTEMLFKAITDKEVNVESETYDILLEIIAENIKMTGANVLKALSKILAIINRKVPVAIILKAAAEIKHFDIDTENIKPVQHFMSHISKFDYSSIPAVQDAINKIQDKMNKIINIVEIQFNKYLDSLEANKASQDLLSIYNVFHDDNIKYYIKNQSKEWKNNLIKLVVQNVKNNPKFKKIKGITARGLGVITGFPGVNINKEDQLTLLYASGNNTCFLLTNPTIDQAAYKEYLSYAIDKDYRKATIGIRESINLFKILYQDREFLKKFIEKCNSTDFRFFITEFINLLKGNSDLEVDHFWTLSEDINYRMKLSDIIDANNIEWFRDLTEIIRIKTNSGQTKRAEKLFKELEFIMAQKNDSQEVNDPQLDLSHRKIYGNSLKEVYDFQEEVLDESIITNIKNFFARPKFNGDKLITYHRTSFSKLVRYNPYLNNENNKDDVEKLKDSEKLEKCLQDIIGDPNSRGTGFRPADGNMWGRGLYSCYTFKEDQAEGYGNIIIAFEVDISNYLIGDRNLAIRVHGTKFTPKQQFLKIIKRREPERFDFFKDQWESYFEGTQEEYSFEDFWENQPDNTYKFIKAITEKYFKGFIFKGGTDGDVCVSYEPQNDSQVYKIGVEGSPYDEHTTNKSLRGKLVWHDSLDSLLQGKAKNKDSFKTINQQKDKNEIELEEKESNNKIIADQILGLVYRYSGIYKNQISYLKSTFNKIKDFKDLVSCFERSKYIMASDGKFTSDFKSGRLEFQISKFNMNNTSMNNNILDRFLSSLSRHDYNFYYKTILDFFDNSNHKDFYIVNAIDNIISFITLNPKAKINSVDANRIINIINNNQEYKKYFLDSLADRLKGRNKEFLVSLLKDVSIDLDLADSDLDNLKFENKIYKAKTLKEVYNF